MKEERVQVRMVPEEKSLLDQLANGAKMTMSDYIKYRVFINNPDLTKDNTIYESPRADKHNYYVMQGIAHALRLLIHVVKEQKGEEAFDVINKQCLEDVFDKISKLGYSKTVLDDE